MQCENCHSIKSSGVKYGLTQFPTSGLMLYAGAVGPGTNFGLYASGPGDVVVVFV